MQSGKTFFYLLQTKGERRQAEEARAGRRRPAPPRQRLCGDRDVRQVLHNIRSAWPFRKGTGWSTYFYFASFFFMNRATAL